LQSLTLISFILYRQLKISNTNCLDETTIPVDTLLYLSLYYLLTIWYTCLIRPSSFWCRCWGLLIFSTKQFKLLISIFIFLPLFSRMYFSVFKNTKIQKKSKNSKIPKKK